MHDINLQCLVVSILVLQSRVDKIRQSQSLFYEN